MTSHDASGTEPVLGVGIVHGNPLMLWALRELLTTQPGLDVRLAEPSLRETPVSTLDVLILDPRACQATSATRLTARVSPHTRVLMMTPPDEDIPSPVPVTASTPGRLSDRSSPRSIVEAVRAAGWSQGLRSHPTDSTTGSALEEHQPAALSVRERQVLTGIAKGLTHDQIANRLRISRHTVDTYVKRVRRKLGLGNKAELTRAAVSQDFLSASW
ncbi:response regulator transcription factor [Streptomyces cyaneochromogenes]|uniref:Response regulator transcription factor n=1 Tax=Streptomyces cyaneochromogenes TaxID=2496836 RepID=A0A3Q9EP68_9ACTN|nr:response regulator transcription factor [Streptomyces cyaneochromogenes]AZQ32390.1 response regulator transcription factor [Streptomyces cyaneochromogenes]